MPDSLQDRERVNNTPGSPNGRIPAQPGKIAVIRADPTKEYVAGGVGGSAQWFSNLARTLPWAIDDVTTDFGDDLYSRMLLDPQVASVVNLFKASIIEDGLQLAPAIDDADTDGYRQAADLCDAAAAMLDDLQPDTDTVLWNLLDGVALGNRVGELLFTLGAGEGGKEQLVLTGLHVKPRTMTAFVVDAYSRVLGLVARIPGVGTGLMQGYLPNPDDVPNLLPRDKFLIYSFRPREGDPRGTSILRPAYTAWQLKQQMIREWVKYLTQFASPSLLGTTAEHAQEAPQLDSLGNPLLDGQGNALPPVTPETAMMQALAAFRNGSIMAVSYGATVEPLFSQGEGKAFIAALDRFDRDIAKAVTSQTLATEQAEHQARAAAETHQDASDTIVRQGKRAIERAFRRDALRQWVRLNYGEQFLSLTPKVTLGHAEEPDLPALWTAVAALKTSGYPAPSQLTALDAQVNLPPRTSEEVQQEKEMGDAALKLATDPPQPAGPTKPGQPTTKGKD